LDHGGESVHDQSGLIAQWLAETGRAVGDLEVEIALCNRIKHATGLKETSSEC
jgi:hypothetical protein